MNDLFQNREVELNPKVLVRKDSSTKNDFTFVVQERVGRFYRVVPNTTRDVLYLKSLNKGYDYFTPADGDGLIISAHVL
tara:strand:- start:4221 stop:4457 length:237 start_codon:yes stop_codon:yes gene_type:complete